MTFEQTTFWLNAKYNGSNIEGLKRLRNDICETLKSIKKEKDDVFNRFKGVHGIFQHSQLDVLDIREAKTCMVIDEIDKMISKLPITNTPRQ